MKLFIFFIMVVFLSGCSLFNSYSGKKTKETIHSSIINEDFTIYLYLPGGYPENGKKYSVLYLTDGDSQFDDSVEIAAKKMDAGEIQKFIIASIGYGPGINQRTRDYTPTQTEDEPGSGGSSKFFDFINSELVPYIDSHYQTDPNRSGRGFGGHSFGGLAVLTSLFLRSDIFSVYLSLSPSLWWDKEILFKYQSDFALVSSNTNISALVFLSVGSQEVDGMPYLIPEMAKRISGMNFPGIKSESVIINGQPHYLSRLDGFSKALEAAY
jgi:predicted alpha/beta superfamily hydrolase